MLIERNFAPVLTLLGGAILLPPGLSALRGQAAALTAGSALLGCGLGAAGVWLSTLLLVAPEQGPRFRAIAGAALGLIALAFTAVAALFALQAAGPRSLAYGVAAALPLLAFAAALYAHR